MPTEPMGELILRAADGDAAAFEDLMRAYEKTVYTLVYRMTQNEEDARDLSQEVFLKIYQALPSFRGDSAFSTWLYRISSNVCIDHARKRGRRRETPSSSISSEGGDDDPVSHLADPRYAPETAFERKQLRESIETALATLSPAHRLIVILRDIEDLHYEEIAKILALSVGTVKSRLARARRALCGALQREGYVAFGKKDGSKGHRQG